MHDLHNNVRTNLTRDELSERKKIRIILRFTKLSWSLLVIFICIERTLSYFSIQEPKTILLSFKIISVMLNAWAALSALPLRNRFIPRSVQAISFVVFVSSLVIVSQITNFSSPDSYQEAVSWFFLACSALCAVFIDLNFIVKILQFCLSYSLMTVVLGNVAFSPDSRLVNFGFNGRLVGFFGHPNVTSFAAIILFSLTIKLKLKFRWLLVSLMILFLTASFTGLIALVGGILVAIFERNTPKRLTIIIGLIIILAIPVIPFLFNSRITTLTDLRLFSYRVEIWHWCIQQLTLSGYHAMPNIFITNFQSQLIFWNHAHNQFLTDLITGGLIKAILTLILLFICLIVCVNSNNRLGSSYSLVIWTSLAITSITEVPLYMDKLDSRALLFSIFLICILSSSTNKVLVNAQQS